MDVNVSEVVEKIPNKDKKDYRIRSSYYSLHSIHISTIIHSIQQIDNITLVTRIHPA